MGLHLIMKTHDYHLLMQQLLPLCLQGLMGVEPQMAIMQLNHVFHCICVKVWNLNEIESLRENVVVIVYLMEK
jgi:hypothetical protein